MFRTRTGCLTCRARRVKCDETRPTCVRCRTSGRQCAGYMTDPRTQRPAKSATNSAGESPSSDPAASPSSEVMISFDNERDRTAYEFFRNYTAPKSTSYSSGDFWTKLVPMMCLRNEALKSSVVALSIIHRGALSASGISNEDRVYAFAKYNDAVRQYNESLGQPQSLRNQQAWLPNVALFPCIETLLGNYGEAKIQVNHGQRMLSERIKDGEGGHDEWMLKTLSHTIQRLEMQALSFSDEKETPSLFPSAPIREYDSVELPAAFESIQQAEQPLLLIIKWAQAVYSVLQWAGNAPASCLAEQFVANALERALSGPDALILSAARCQSYLRQWQHLFSKYLLSLSAASRMRHADAITHLEVLHAYGTLVATPTTNEGDWDTYNLDFARLVDLAAPAVARRTPTATRTVVFSLEPGLVSPLFFAAFRCRDPCIRRTALNAMRSLRCREGPWDSDAASQCIDYLLTLEEGGLPHVAAAADIPLDRRISLVIPNVDLDNRRMELSYYRQPYGPDGPWAIDKANFTILQTASG